METGCQCSELLEGAEQYQDEAETKIVQLWQKVERLLSSLGNAKRRAEDAGLARGEQMRLQLQEALAEACKEKDAATKKAAVAEATCALLRVQENHVLEVTQKWTADAVRRRAEAEAKLEDAERCRCAYINIRRWIVHSYRPTGRFIHNHKLVKISATEEDENAPAQE